MDETSKDKLIEICYQLLEELEWYESAFASRPSLRDVKAKARVILNNETNA